MFEIHQLVDRIDRHIPVSAEDYLRAFFYENANKDVRICTICNARGGFRGEQHAPECRRASVLVLDNWLDVYRQREVEPRVGDQ